MCGPIASLAATAVGTLVSMAGANYSAQAQANQYRYQQEVANNNAAIADKQAETAAMSGAQKAQLQFMKEMRIKSSQAAGFSANGLDIGAGSPLDVLTDTERIAQLDKANLEYDSANNVWAIKNQANDYRNQAALYGDASNNSLIAGRYSMMGSLLSGVSSYAKDWSVFKKNGQL